MEDDRLEQTESWSSRDRKRFWFAVAVSMFLFAAALFALWMWFVNTLTIPVAG